MRKKNYKGRCEKKYLQKSKDVCKTYDIIQTKYADMLSEDDNISEICCNVVLEEKFNDNEYMSDFLCTKTDGDKMVRECVFRRYLTKPLTVKLLDFSRNYWTRHGINDWGIVIDE